jgi:N-methylhydantoinase B/oxoprolinase/acetone carboxylase alpha subunit
MLAPGRLTPQPGRPAISGTRLLADNISDLKAQVAANQKGIELVLEMVEHYGLDVVQAYMGHVQDAAEAAVRNRLTELSRIQGHAGKGIRYKAVDYLDDGSPIALALDHRPQRRQRRIRLYRDRPRDLGQLQCTVSSCTVRHSLQPAMPHRKRSAPQ